LATSAIERSEDTSPYLYIIVAIVLEAVFKIPGELNNIFGRESIFDLCELFRNCTGSISQRSPVAGSVTTKELSRMFQVIAE
jgi:hypothetical protein